MYKAFDFIIEQSKRKDKKYQARLKSDPNGKVVHFGAIKVDGTPYEQYRDSTPLKLYKKYDHYDVDRMIRYHMRHQKDINGGFNAGTLSAMFLWS